MKIHEICTSYNIGLCYLFGSQQERGEALLRGEPAEPLDRASDIDFAVHFIDPPADVLDVYARLSVDLNELVSPMQADLLFLHEVDHLIQLEAVSGINVYSADEAYKQTFEHEVMALAADEWILFRLNEKDFFEAMDDGYFEFKYQADRG